MKNLFWFLRQPADERETALYEKAFRRSFLAIVWSFIIIVVVSAATRYLFAFSGMPLPTGREVHFVYLNGLEVLIFLVAAIAEFAGWTVLRKEELAPVTPQPIPSTKKLNKLVIAFVLSLPVLIISVIAIFPGYFMEIMVGSYILHRIILSVLAWRYAAWMSTASRVASSIFVPLLTIFYTLLHHVQRSWVRTLCSILLDIVVSVAITMFVAATSITFTRMFIVTPMFFRNANFEPEYKENSYHLMRKCKGCEVDVGEIAVFGKEGVRGIMVGRVKQVNGDEIVMVLGNQPDAKEVVIHRKQIIADKFIEPSPNLKRFISSLEAK